MKCPRCGSDKREDLENKELTSDEEGWKAKYYCNYCEKEFIYPDDCQDSEEKNTDIEVQESKEYEQQRLF